MGKLDGKVAVITGGSTGMALAGAKLFVEEGAHVFIQARRQEALDDAVKLIGRNVTAVQGYAAELDDLDRLYDTVKLEKGSIDVLWASAGMGEPAVLGEITEEQFHRAFWLNARGTLFTVQKALPLINDNGSIFMTESNASLGAFPGWSLYAGSKAVQQAWARVWLNELRDRKIRVNVLTPGQVATAKQEELFDEATKDAFESLIPAERWAAPKKSPLSPCSSPPTTPATSTAWNWSPTAAPPPSDHTPGMAWAHPTTTQSPQRIDFESARTRQSDTPRTGREHTS